MELFHGGMFRKEQTAAASPLSENDFGNEPSKVEMRDQTMTVVLHEGAEVKTVTLGPRQL